MSKEIKFFNTSFEPYKISYCENLEDCEKIDQSSRFKTTKEGDFQLSYHPFQSSQLIYLCSKCSNKYNKDQGKYLISKEKFIRNENHEVWLCNQCIKNFKDDSFKVLDGKLFENYLSLPHKLFFENYNLQLNNL